MTSMSPPSRENMTTAQSPRPTMMASSGATPTSSRERSVLNMESSTTPPRAVVRPSPEVEHARNKAFRRSTGTLGRGDEPRADGDDLGPVHGRDVAARQEEHPGERKMGDDQAEVGVVDR